MGLTFALLWAVGQCFHLSGPQLPQLHNGSESIFPVGRLWGMLANSTLAHGYEGHDHPVVLVGWVVSCHAG